MTLHKEDLINIAVEKSNQAIKSAKDNIENNNLEDLPTEDSFINENSIELLNDTYGKIIPESTEIAEST